MGYGLDEDLGFLAEVDDNDRRLDEGRLTDQEKMLDWLEMTSREFAELSGNCQSNLRWQWRKFGKTLRSE